MNILLAIVLWVYQLSGYTGDSLNEITASCYQLAVVDLARDGSSDYWTASEIEATGKIMLAYFEIGAIENYRPEWDSVPDELKLGAVGGYPNEQYVAYWDERWWTVVKGRVDQALAAGFDGAYLDMIVTYEEIPANSAGTDRDDLAQKMVDLIARLSAYAKSQNAEFLVLPQNSPELRLFDGYLTAIDGIGMEEMYVRATNRLCNLSWCYENIANAKAIAEAGKTVLSIDYATTPEMIDYATQSSLTDGFVPLVSVVTLDIVPTCESSDVREVDLQAQPNFSTALLFVFALFLALVKKS